eukprot:12843_1
MLLSVQLYLSIQQIATVTTHFAISIWSHLLHLLYSITNYPLFLLWEFKSARYIHLKQRELCIGFILICVITGLVIALVFPTLSWISGLSSTLFLGHSIYRLFINPDRNATWMDRITECTVSVERKLESIVQKIIYIWFQNSFLYNAKLVQIKLNKEIKSHYQTVSSLNDNSIQNSELSLPIEVNQIIIDYVFHDPIQQLFTEELVSNMLTQQWNLKAFIIQQIIEYTFDLSHKKRICFQISYGDGLGGSLGGRVAICKDTNPKRAMRLNVNYGCGKMPNVDQPCLELDLTTNELFDVCQTHSIKKQIDCSKVTIPLAYL